MSTPASPLLSPSQLAALAEIGEQRSAPIGALLYRVGDRTYPFIAILEGEVAILDAAGNEIVRHGRLGLPRGAEPPVRADGLRDRARDRSRCATSRSTATRCARCSSTTARSATSSSRPSSPAARRCSSVQGIGLEIVGPRSSEATMRMLDFARANRLPFTWQETAPPDGGASPLVRLPGGAELHGPIARRGAARARDRPRARAARGGRPARRRRRSGRPRRRGLRRLRGTRHAGRREHRARRPGRVVPPDRELPRLPGRDQRHRAHRAAPSARRASSTRAPRRRTARSRSNPATDGIVVRLEDDHEIAARAVLLATGAAVPAAPVDDSRTTRD